jgi:uncharacterized membrane protein
MGITALWHRHPGVRSGEQLTLGERLADRVRNGMGSWPFVATFIGLMIVWAVANTVFHVGSGGGRSGFDPYPYILLNLALSMMAGMQGAILLIAAKRADQVSSELAVHTYSNTESLRTLIEYNNGLTERIAALTEEIARLNHAVASTPTGAVGPAPDQSPAD